MIRQESLRKSVDEPVRFADADEKTHKSFLGCISVPVSQDQTPLASGGVGVRRSSRARRLALPFCVAFLSVLVVILIAVVAWLVVIMKRLVREVRVRRVASQRLASRRLTRRPLPTQNPPVALSYGPVTTSGYSSWGSLFRGSGTWVVNPNPMPFGGISDMGVVSDADYLYVFGGGRVGNDSAPLFGQLWQYDTVYEAYTRLADMPVPQTRFGFAQANGLVFAVGGFMGDTGAGDCYDPSCPPTGVNYATVGDVTSANPGRTGAFTQVFNISSGAWLATPAVQALRLNTNRSDSCAVAVGSKIYVAGGYSEGYNITDAFEVLDTSAAVWAWTPLPRVPGRRGDLQCAAINGTVYVFGGFYDPYCSTQLGCFGGPDMGTDAFQNGSSSFRTEMWGFNTQTGSWATKASMHYGRGDAAFASLPGGRLLAMGGEHNLRTTNVKVPQHSVEMYYEDVDAWVEKAPLAYARFRFSAASVGQTTFAFGGQQICFTDPANSTGAPAEDVPYCQLTAANTLSVLYELDLPHAFVGLPNSVSGAGITYDDALFTAEYVNNPQFQDAKDNS